MTIEEYKESLRKKFISIQGEPVKDKKYYRAIMHVEYDWDGNLTTDSYITFANGKGWKETSKRTFFGNTKLEKVTVRKSANVYAVKKDSGIYEMVTGKPLAVWGGGKYSDCVLCYGLQLVEKNEELVKMANELKELESDYKLKCNYIAGLSDYQQDVLEKKAEALAKANAKKAEEKEAVKFLNKYR